MAGPIRLADGRPSVAQQGMAAMFYGVSSVMIMAVNKVTLTVYGFPSSAFLALSQVMCSIIILRVAKMLGLVTFPDFSMSACRKVFPLPLIFLANTVTGLSGTKAISLPMFAVLRRFSILFTMVLEARLLGNTFQFGLKLSVFLMLLGAIVAAFSDLAFDLNGYTWIMANNACTAANGVFMKKMLDPKDKSSLGKFGLMYYNCLLSLPVVMMVVYTEGKLQEIRNFADLGNAAFQIYFVASSVMGFVLTFAIVVCTQVNSALTTTVVGCIKNVLISYGGMMIGGDYIFSWMNFIGLNVSIGGSLYYSYIQTRRPPEQSASNDTKTKPSSKKAPAKLEQVTVGN